MKITIQYLENPDSRLDQKAQKKLIEELRHVAAECFESVPEYQCLSGSGTVLKNKILSLARDEKGSLVGFCSSLRLPVKNVGHVLHLGLTCVSPRIRGKGLTHKLTSKLVTHYFLRHGLVSGIWISNVACVLSSLGNVALNFDSVYPSPYFKQQPQATHLEVARAIDKNFRNEIYIRQDARFDAKNFVFRQSVKDTVFQKRRDDQRYWHRDDGLNQYYAGRMNFSEGDEMLQVGFVGPMTPVRYFSRRLTRQLKSTMKLLKPRPAVGL